jgi:uncharacterized membrane protein
MEEESLKLKIDIDSFQICPYCLKLVPIILVEGYLLFLLVKELFKARRSYYDKTDIVIFAYSIMCIIADLSSLLVLETAISTVSHVMRVIWAMLLFLVFLRFVLDEPKCVRWYLFSIFVLACYFLISIAYYQTIPVRYSLLAIYLTIGVCAFHQIVYIQELLNNDSARKKEQKNNLYHRVINDN